MKVCEIPLVVMSFLGLGLFSSLDAPPAHADFVFGTPTNLGPTVNSKYDDYEPRISPDGLELYFCSDRPGGYGGPDIWVTKRSHIEDPWGPPANLGPQINTSGWDAPGSMSADGLVLYMEGLYTTTRATRDAPWGARVNLGPIVSGSYGGAVPVVSPDGLELYFSVIRPGGYGYWDIWVSTRATTSDPWGTPVNLGATVNSPGTDAPTWISPDGLTLLLFSDRPGGFGGVDAWMTTRASKASPWSPPRNLGPSFNTQYSEWITAVSPDGRLCYFCDFGLGAYLERPDGLGWSDIWQAPITPIMDFDGDGKVDGRDMAILAADWGKSDSICDIGPLPFGDGTVDEKDLSVLMKEITGTAFVRSPLAHESEIPCGGSLTWTAVPFAASYDVYFGTSWALISAASRAAPLGMLVSQGQTATAYHPPVALEFGRTYCWRIDFVSAGPAPTIYKGCVLDFTTEAFAYPIKNVIATASSAQPSMGPEKTIDGSGLDKNDGHSTTGADMWLSTGTQPNWIQYQFDKVYVLHELWVWNSNQLIESFLGFGAKAVKIEYSVDGAKWIQLANVPEFARAPGQPGYLHNTTVNLGGVSAKYVKLTIEKNWGAAQPTGLSEVRFFYIPDRPAPKP